MGCPHLFVCLCLPMSKCQNVTWHIQVPRAFCFMPWASCYGIVSRSVLAKLLINANRLLPQPIMAWLSLQISGWYLAVVYICFRIPFIVVPVALLIFSRSHTVWWSHNSIYIYRYSVCVCTYTVRLYNIYIYVPMYNIRAELCFTRPAALQLDSDPPASELICFA